MNNDMLIYNDEIIDKFLNPPPHIQSVFDELRKDMEKQEQQRRKEYLNDLLETLPYIYVHGDKYVSIEDVLTLI